MRAIQNVFATGMGDPVADPHKFGTGRRSLVPAVSGRKRAHPDFIPADAPPVAFVALLPFPFAHGLANSLPVLIPIVALVIVALSAGASFLFALAETADRKTGVQRVLKADVSGNGAPTDARKGATP